MPETTSAYRGPTGDGLTRLMRRLQTIERAIQALQGGSALSSAGIGVDSDGMVVNSSLAVVGDLTLRQGVIQGSALAHQVTGMQSRSTETGFAVTTAWTAKATTTATVPEWATTALVMATASVTCRMGNGEGNDSRLRVRAAIHGGSGGIVGTFPYEAGGMILEASSSASWSATVNVASLGSFAITAQARAERNVWYPAHASNTATINGLVIFLR